NWCVMYDLPEQVAEEVVLAHPLKVTATPLANSSFSESSNLQGKSHQALRRKRRALFSRQVLNPLGGVNGHNH
ncbi:MAG: hypothetical protein V3S16_12655, partial [Candidatus Desulfatibia sp.]|uniref:hypothetical protein n=1 Tax=Candidatus Desulfatibia sp. TaxID=3101189 RepID=UPI002F34CE0A